jgi:Holliday junction DNA helicase RuvA
MIAKLTGIIDTIGDTFLIIDVGGVGYYVSCSSRTLASIGGSGERAVLYIETVMRAESLQLFGFGSSDEQDCFKLLTTVQGVGMRMGLSLLSALCPADVYQAIVHQDKAMLTRADGVGPKLASRILSELKDKVPSGIGFASNMNPQPFGIGPSSEEAVSALMNLGYKRIEAVTAVAKAQQQIGEDAPLNELIRSGLSHLARSGT